ERALGGGSSLSQHSRERTEGPSYIRTFLEGNRNSLVDRGCDRLVVVGNLPQQFAAGSFFNILVGEAGNLFETVKDDAYAIARRAIFQKCTNAAGTPQRYDVGVRDQQHGVR